MQKIRSHLPAYTMGLWKNSVSLPDRIFLLAVLAPLSLPSASLFISLIKLIIYVNRTMVIENKQAVIWLRCSSELWVFVPLASAALGHPVKRHLSAAGHLAAEQACMWRTLTPPTPCLLSHTQHTELFPHKQPPSQHPTHPCLTVTRPDSCSDRQRDVYWLSGNLLRKSASPHFQICIFKSTLTSVYLCPTTSQQNLLCPNLKRVSQFPKVKCLKCLEECKRNVVEIIQEEIAAIFLVKMFSLKCSWESLEASQENTQTYLPSSGLLFQTFNWSG